MSLDADIMNRIEAAAEDVNRAFIQRVRDLIARNPDKIRQLALFSTTHPESVKCLLELVDGLKEAELVSTSHNFGPHSAAAGVALDAALLEGDNAVFSCVNSEVSAHKSAVASSFGHAHLAHDYVAVFTLPPPKTLTPSRWPALSWMFFTGCTCFN